MVDCPAAIIAMGEDGIPCIAEADEKKCYKCQHCLAICPTAAVSIFGKLPENSAPYTKKANAEQMDALIRNRRTVRRFKKGDVAPEKIDLMLKAAANAPTGKNAREVEITLVDTTAVMDKVKDMIISKIEDRDKKGLLKGPEAAFATRAKLFRDGKDYIFRNAPHMMIAATPKTAPTPLADGFIALSYAELMADTLGVGVIWAGFVMHILHLCPEILPELGIDENTHELAYVILFGESAIKYPRGVQRDDITVKKIS